VNRVALACIANSRLGGLRQAVNCYGFVHMNGAPIVAGSEIQNGLGDSVERAGAGGSVIK